VPLPPDISTVTVTGTFLDAAGNPLRGKVSFTPTSVITDLAGHTVLDGTRTCQLSGGTFTSGPLAATDSAGLQPAGWQYQVAVELQDAPPAVYLLSIPQSFAPADISALIAQGG
jgi:hypothetical protein